VERNHGLDQDRLVKELRLAGISTIDEANRFLDETYLPKMNAKFSCPAAEAADAHVPLGGVDMADIMCHEYGRLRLRQQPAWKERTTRIMGTPPRTVSNDYVVRSEIEMPKNGCQGNNAA
jgi:hypothetical protein